MDIALALLQYDPAMEFGCGETLDSLNWMSGTKPKPTQADLDTAWREYLAMRASTKYLRLRKENRPSVEGQLDKIYTDGLDAWKLQMKAIDDAFPKPL